ncbi:MAG: hypothetical protein ACTHLB_05450 [Parafilimonas sp.]
MKFGILQEKYNAQQTINLAKEAGINLVRAAVNFKDDYISKKIDAYLKAGLQVQINFNYKQSPNGIPFPTDLNFVARQAQLFFNYHLPYVRQIPYVAVENEWCNPQYHTGTVQDYINELKVVVEIAHAHGFKVADSGTTTVGLTGWYASTLNPIELLAFRKDYFINKKIIPYVNQFVNLIREVPVDYLNVHLYNENFGGRFPKITEAFANACGKEALTCNEFGVKKSELWATTVAEIKACNLHHAIAYSGMNKPGKAIQLTEKNLQLLK